MVPNPEFDTYRLWMAGHRRTGFAIASAVPRRGGWLAEMTGRSTTQLDLSAHRFLARRMERALRSGQVTGGPIPGRGALMLGWLLSAVVAAVAVLLAVVWPQPDLGDAPIVLNAIPEATAGAVAD